MMETLSFINSQGDFILQDAANVGGLYFPLVNEAGMISSVTPGLGGDCKTGQNTFLLAPASGETLHESRATRNFWCAVKGKRPWSATGESVWQRFYRFSDKQETVTIEGGLLWHKVTRKNPDAGLSSEILSFVPAGKDAVEIMQVTVCNIGEEKLSFIPTAAIPLYGRSADNIRDHRHVTSLLQRLRTLKYGVELKPSLTFDERGHRLGKTCFQVYAAAQEGEAPVGFCPIVQDFIGEGGSYDWPKGIVSGDVRFHPAGMKAEGFEMIAAIRFAETTLNPGEKKSFQIVLGVNADCTAYLSKARVQAAFTETCAFWQSKIGVAFNTSNPDFDRWMRWVSIQPVLRRICGCSFMPHHDYGKGGRGWRDLWQDCLALILIEPERVRPMLLNNFCGVRLDGTNATIIGVEPGEFLADRNNLVRVWMDHGMWPLVTTALYIRQSGDFSLLFEELPYFKDKQVSRGEAPGTKWEPAAGCVQTVQGQAYKGTVLEHLLIQNVTAFFDVGTHGHIRLRGADWNDGLDMAGENGESVAFTAAYAGNLDTLAQLSDTLLKKGLENVSLSRELAELLNEPISSYGNVSMMQSALVSYCGACLHFSGAKILFGTCRLAEILRAMSRYIKEHIRAREWVSDGAEQHWFNSYYDNHGKQAEGMRGDKACMMLTGQVFTILSGTADDTQIREIIRAADWYLYYPARGGYCLNTDFQEIRMDLGRMFGFAYGHKENGAVFSHMSIMYAYALYSRGYVFAGFKVLEALYDQCRDFHISRIYPGIPEYFDPRGRGMYPYLTGAGSWLLLTMQEQVFGVQGRDGDLVLHPKLTAAQFNSRNEAEIQCIFAGVKLRIVYSNAQALEYGSYHIRQGTLDEWHDSGEGARLTIPREELLRYADGKLHTLRIDLCNGQP